MTFHARAVRTRRQLCVRPSPPPPRSPQTANRSRAYGLDARRHDGDIRATPYRIETRGSQNAERLRSVPADDESQARVRGLRRGHAVASTREVTSARLPLARCE